MNFPAFPDNLNIFSEKVLLVYAIDPQKRPRIDFLPCLCVFVWFGKNNAK